jgi:DNA repair protein RadC
MDNDLQPHLLTDPELFALLLDQNVNLKTVQHLANSVCEKFRRYGTTLSANQIKQIPGVNMDEARRIFATLELIRRQTKRSSPRIQSPEDAYSLVRHLALKKQEHFISISLNSAHDVIALRTVTKGLVNRAETHPREVFADIITDRACAVIVAHNHPSNNLSPSDADKSLTIRLNSAGNILGIPLLDHLIFGAHGFISLKEQHSELFERH